MRKLWAAVVKLLWCENRRSSEDTLTVTVYFKSFWVVQRQCCKEKCLNTTLGLLLAQSHSPVGLLGIHPKQIRIRWKGRRVHMFPYPCLWFLYDSRGRLRALLQQTRTVGWAEMSQGHGQWGNSAEERWSDSSQPPLTQATPLEKFTASQRRFCEQKLDRICL